MIIKICGISEIDTLKACINNNVDFYGMIFYGRSPRNIKINVAKKLQLYSRNYDIRGVGVFVNEKLSILTKYVNEIDLKFVQLHGNEDDNYIEEIKKLGVRVIKKISIKNYSDLKEIENYKQADYLLFDYKPEKNELPGGNAKSFNWKIIKNLTIDKPWFLSGGINSNNIEFIIKEINPFGVDLSSGLEKKLGIKDNHIINNFMSKFKNA